MALSEIMELALQTDLQLLGQGPFHRQMSLCPSGTYCPYLIPYMINPG